MKGLNLRFLYIVIIKNNALYETFSKKIYGSYYHICRLTYIEICRFTLVLQKTSEKLSDYTDGTPPLPKKCKFIPLSLNINVA